MKKNTGFTLIEVLIAMVIMAVGLLGLAGLQATSIRNNNDAYMRSQATQLAYDITDRMRANMTAVDADTYTSTLPNSAVAACSTTTGCTATQMAQTDMFEWNQMIANTLTGGTGSLAVAGNIFTVTLSWVDDKDGIGSNNPSFQTSFQL